MKIKAIKVCPGKPAQTVLVENDLPSLQRAVGGLIQALYPFNDEVAIICNDEGKIDRLPANRAIYDLLGNMTDFIAGNFLVVGTGEEDFCSLDDALLKKYLEYYAVPEYFFVVDGKAMASKYGKFDKFPVFYGSPRTAAEKDTRDFSNAILFSMNGELAAFLKPPAPDNKDIKDFIAGWKAVYGREKSAIVLAVNCSKLKESTRLSEANKKWAVKVRIPSGISFVPTEDGDKAETLDKIITLFKEV